MNYFESTNEGVENSTNDELCNFNEGQKADVFKVFVTNTLNILGIPVLLIVTIITILSLIAPEQAIQTVVFTMDAVLNILPFIILSVVIAAACKASGADKLIARAFAGSPAKAILMASFFGAISPFCSCGVIPIVASLLAAGVPIAPVLAFCIASPIMDPQMFVLTAAELGLEFGLVKTIAAVGMGLMTGYLTLLISKTEFLTDSLKNIARPSCAKSTYTDTEIDIKPVWKFWQQSVRMSVFWVESRTAGWFLGRWLTFAFVLESLMVAYLPGEMVATLLGDGNALAIPLAVLVGIPAYLNGYAAIPLVGSLIDLGMSPATGLSFMLAGSVTSIPAAIAVWTIAKPRLFGLYFVMATFGALLSGFLYNAFLTLS